MSRPQPAHHTVAVVGEILADVLPGSDSVKGGLQLIARLGGSPANVAVGLSRLGVDTVFAGRLSPVGLGPWLREHLQDNGVRVISPDVPAQENCSLAMATLDEAGRATYTFYVQGTADWQWRPHELPDLDTLGVGTVHTGSLALALEPGRSVLAAWLAHLSAKRRILVSLDPNVRASLIDDLAGYRRHLADLVSLAHIIKTSDDDLTTLYPEELALDAAERWAASGPELVVVTHGPGGATALRPNGSVLHREAPQVAVTDTVGAGDAFTAGLLAQLASNDALQFTGLAKLSQQKLVQALDFANKVAAITCTRHGADPPRRSEL